MRVLTILNSLELGGTQINAVDLAAAVRHHGFESIVVGPSDTLPGGPSVLDVAAERGVGIEVYNPHPSMAGRSRQLAEIAGRHGAELMHVYGSWGGSARPAYWGFSRFGRRPWVQTVYEMEVAPEIKRHMPLIVGTGYLIDDLSTRPGATVLISPPVDMESDRPDSAAGAAFRADHGLDGPLLVIVSRLDVSMKSLPISIAIDAMRDLASVVTLAIVGTGDDEERLRALGNEVNTVTGRTAVRFIGPLANPRPAYAASDIMLGMGGSAARTLAFGKPLVVQGENGWVELFDESTAERLARNSYWSPDHMPDAREQIITLVRTLIRDDVRRAHLGEFGRRFATVRFGLTAMAARLAELYERATVSYGLREWLADLPPEAPLAARKAAQVLPRIRHRNVATP